MVAETLNRKPSGSSSDTQNLNWSSKNLVSVASVAMCWRQTFAGRCTFLEYFPSSLNCCSQKDLTFVMKIKWPLCVHSFYYYRHVLMIIFI